MFLFFESGQPIALRVLSAMTSCSKGTSSFFQIDLASPAVLMQYACTVSSSIFFILKSLLEIFSQSSDSIHDGLAPASIFTSKAEHAVGASLLLNMFTSRYHALLAFRILSYKASCIFSSRLSTYPRILNFSATATRTDLSPHRPQHFLVLLLQTCSPTTNFCNFRFHVPSSHLIHQFFHHQIQVLFSMKNMKLTCANVADDSG